MKEVIFSVIPLLLILLMCVNIGCEDDLKVQDDYPFTVTHLPVPKRLKKGETVEIRFELIREGKFKDARYFVRFFQPDGSGLLTLDGRTMTPNDALELKKDEFRMYYTSECEESQTIDLTFYDNHKNTFELTFSFANDSK